MAQSDGLKPDGAQADGTLAEGARPDGARPDGAGRGGKGIRVALALSVALNLLVLGVVAGAVLRDGGSRGAMSSDPGFGLFTEALSDEDRAALRQGFYARMPDMRDMRQRMRDDFAGLLAALRAEPFDPAALREVMAGQSARMAERLDLGQDLLLERIGGMTPAARAAFADRLESRVRRGPDTRGHD